MSIRFVPEDSVPNEGGMLGWIYRHFQNISAAINNKANGDQEIRHAEPAKLYEGLMVYADGDDWDPGCGKGEYIYKNSKWWFLADIMEDGLWNDYMGNLSGGAKGVTNPPAFDIFRGAQRANNFAVGDEMWVEIHVEHDYKVGTDMYPHVHWATDSASPAGNAVWQLDWSVAKRNDVTPEAFPLDTTITLTQAMSVQYGHMVVEASDLQTIPATEVEVDCLILIRIERLTDGLGGAGGDSLNVFGMQVDLHYLMDRLGTINKAPDFYT